MEQSNPIPFEPMQFLNGKPITKANIMEVYWQQIAKERDLFIKLQPNWQWGFLTFVVLR